jgi:type IV pilus assembly protein PilX
MALIIVLIFLSAITGLTIYSVRQSLFGEGTARNQMDSEVARQAAEAALRDAERDIMNLTATTLTNASCTRGRDRPPIISDFTSDCVQGYCILPETDYADANWTDATSATTDAEPWWPTGRGGRWNNTFAGKPGRSPVTSTNCTTFTGGVPFGTFTGTNPIQGVAVQPEYLVEAFVRRSPISRKETNYYRITARGFGYTQRTQVVLQTIYAPLQDP